MDSIPSLPDHCDISLAVNGRAAQLRIPANMLLLDLLRTEFGLTGTKEGCGVGVCGACTVLLDGAMISSCLMLAARADGCSITTVEGLADGEVRASALQDAFATNGAVQCGFCTPGQIIAASALLAENPKPTEIEVKEWLMGNLCRCTGYYRIVDAVLKASEATSS